MKTLVRLLAALCLLLLFAWFTATAQLAEAVARPTSTPEVSPNFTCPKRGEVNLVIPAGETQTVIEILTGCPGNAHVTVTGGSEFDTPVIINARMAHSSLVIHAYILTTQAGPVDVKAWYEVSAP